LTALQFIIAGAIVFAVALLFAVIGGEPYDAEEAVFLGAAWASGVSLMAAGISKAVVK